MLWRLIHVSCGINGFKFVIVTHRTSPALEKWPTRNEELLKKTIELDPSQRNSDLALKSRLRKKLEKREFLLLVSFCLKPKHFLFLPCLATGDDKWVSRINRKRNCGYHKMWNQWQARIPSIEVLIFFLVGYERSRPIQATEPRDDHHRIDLCPAIWLVNLSILSRVFCFWE